MSREQITDAVEVAKAQGLSPRDVSKQVAAVATERQLTNEEAQASVAAIAADMAACRRLALELARVVVDELGREIAQYPRTSKAALDLALWQLKGGDWEELDEDY